MKPYRKNVGMIVFNSSGRVLVGDRLQYKGAFQFPQGGMDKGEKPLKSALRELYEEVGLQMDRPVTELEEWFYYEFPENVPDKLKKYRGQQQKWFLFFWDGDPSTLDLDLHQREFAGVRWMDFDEVVEQIVPFKRQVYQQLLITGKPLIQEYLLKGNV